MPALILLAAVAAQAAIAPESKACRDLDPGSPTIAFTTQLVRQGDRVGIRPRVDHPWMGKQDARWSCFRHWKVSDPKLARIDARRGELVIAPDAPAGSDVTVSAEFKGTPVVPAASARATLRIVARAAVVLTGTWHEVGRRDCEGEPVGELIFNPRGGYSFTLASQMIETMTSGGGAYDWNPETRVLAMGQDKGFAMLADDLLEISGIDFHPRTPLPPGEDRRGPCILSFARTK